MMRRLLLAFSVFLTTASELMALSVQVGSYPEVCGYANGRAWASPYGGTAPYTYLWDGGATTQQLSGLLPGSYAVTVTDNLGAQASGNTTVAASSELLVGQGSNMPTCPAYCSGELYFVKEEFAGTPPYTYSLLPSSEDALNIYYGGVCWYAEQDSLTITDVNGCSVTTPFGVSNSYYSQVQILQIMPSCQGVNGHVTFQLSFTMLTTLRVFDAQQNEVYTDYAPLEQGIVTVDELPPGDYTIRSISNEIPGEWCYGETPFTMPDLGTDCGRIMGRLFVDQTDDCLFQPEETGMPFRVLTVQPGPVYGMTDASGNYTINLNEASYTI